jgi:hypothetical protein
MMNPNTADFNSGAVAPVECLKEGWALIKDRYWLFLGISLVGILIGGAVPLILMGPMMVGIFLCLFRRMRGEPVEFGMLFKGFDYFVQSLVVALIKAIPMIIIIVPSYLIMAVVMMSTMPRNHPTPDETSTFMLSFFGFEIVFVVVIVVVGLAVETLFIFAFPLVIDRKLAGWDAIKLSIKAGKANFGGVLGLLLLNAAVGFVGVLCCIVGVYFVMPVTLAAQAIAYRRVFPETLQTFAAPPPPPASWA